MGVILLSRCARNESRFSSSQKETMRRRVLYLAGLWHQWWWPNVEAENVTFPESKIKRKNKFVYDTYFIWAWYWENKGRTSWVPVALISVVKPSEKKSKTIAFYFSQAFCFSNIKLKWVCILPLCFSFLLTFDPWIVMLSNLRIRSLTLASHYCRV